MRAPRRLASVLLLSLSFFGLVLVGLFAVLPQTMHDDASWRKPLLGAAFSIVLILGILAGLVPTTCTGRVHFRTSEVGETTKSGASLSGTVCFRGHHPDCGNFATHVFQVGHANFCAGCGGLILGAIFSLLGVVGYFFLDFPLVPSHLVIFWVGSAGVACGLLQYHLFNWSGSSVHLLLNVFFVVGVFMLLSGVEALTRSTTIGMYVIVLSVFWLYTRISLSQAHHRRICTACGRENCGYN